MAPSNCCRKVALPGNVVADADFESYRKRMGTVLLAGLMKSWFGNTSFALGHRDDADLTLVLAGHGQPQRPDSRSDRTSTAEIAVVVSDLAVAG